MSSTRNSNPARPNTPRHHFIQRRGFDSRAAVSTRLTEASQRELRSDNAELGLFVLTARPFAHPAARGFSTGGENRRSRRTLRTRQTGENRSRPDKVDSSP